MPYKISRILNLDEIGARIDTQTNGQKGTLSKLETFGH